MTVIRCPVHAAAARFPNRAAMVSPDRQLTYREWDDRVAQAAGQLQESGILSGQRVAILFPNDPEYLVLLFALWRIGATACPLNTRNPAATIKKHIESLNCETCLVHPSLPLTFKIKGTRVRRVMFEAKGLTAKNPPAGLNLHAVATILLTSGSSGQPKAVVHSLGNHYFNAKGSNKNIPVGPGDRWFLSLPLYHVSGLGIVWRCALAGGAIVFSKQHDPIGGVIKRFSVTHVSLVATQLFRLLKNKNDIEALQGLKAILLGGGPLAEDLLKKSLQLRLPIHTTYGLTEMASQVATSPNFRKTLTNIPKAGILPYRNLKMSSDREILVRGKTLFRGYWKEGKIIKATDQHGWFATGDLGKLDRTGGLTVTGRKDRMFISGGENIDPAEIEKVLLATGLVSEAVVIPEKDMEFGARPVAHLKTISGKRIAAAALRSALRRMLPSYKIPVRFYQ